MKKMRLSKLYKLSILSTLILVIMILSHAVASYEVSDMLKEADLKINDLNYHEGINDLDAVEEDLDQLIDIDIQLCIIQAAFNSVKYLEKIYLETSRGDTIPGLWIQFGDKLLVSKCQGSWQFASDAYKKGALYLKSIGEITKLKEYYQQVGKKYDKSFAETDSDYAKFMISLEAAKFHSSANEIEKTNQYLEYFKKYNEGTFGSNRDISFKELYDTQILICIDEKCSQNYSFVDLNKKLMLKFNLFLGDRIVESAKKGVLMSPSGKIIKIGDTDIFDFTPTEEGAYLVTVNFTNDYTEIIDNNEFFASYKDYTLPEFRKQQNLISNKNTQIISKNLIIYFLLLIILSLIIYIFVHKNDTLRKNRRVN